jgi:hypothetical protein
VTYTTDDEIAPLRWQPPRALGVIVAVLAAAGLVVACFSHRWLRTEEIGYSPLEAERCSPACSRSSNFQLFETAKKLPFEEDRVARAFPIAGAVSFAALLLAAAGLLVAAGIAAANRHPDLPISPTTISLVGLMLGLISGCVFVGTRPGAPGSVALSWSFWLFGLGAVAGITATHLLARQIRPRDPDLLHDAMNLDQF